MQHEKLISKIQASVNPAGRDPKAVWPDFEKLVYQFEGKRFVYDDNGKWTVVDA